MYSKLRQNNPAIMFIIRDTTESDVTELVKLRNAPTQLQSFLNEADDGGIRFLVYEQDDEICGFAMLFLRQPSQGCLLKTERTTGGLSEKR